MEKERIGTPVFQLADKVGVKREMIDTARQLLKMYKNTPPKFFGPEDVMFMLDEGMKRGGATDNFKVSSLFVLCTAYLYGYLLGRKMSK